MLQFIESAPVFVRTAGNAGPMPPAFKRNCLPVLALTLGLANTLAGCSAGPVIDQLPGDLGLPAGAPSRPAAPYDYPAVHDMPPPRPTRTMSDEEQFRLENELTAVRKRQEGRLAPGKNIAPTAKEKPTTAENDEPAGTKSKP
jgi:hypothetical protein